MVPYAATMRASIVGPSVRSLCGLRRGGMPVAAGRLRVKATRDLSVHIIDDDSAVRAGFARLLRSAGLDVHAYETAEAFLSRIDEAAPGCILLDVTMPGITGPEAMTRLTAARNSLPVIVVSARDNDSVHDLVRGLGAKMFLHKPVDDQALLDAIHWVSGARADR